LRRDLKDEKERAASAFIEVFSTTNSGSEGMKGIREPWVRFGGAFREISDDRSIFVQ